MRKARIERATPMPKIKKALPKSISLMLAALAVFLESLAKHLSALGTHGNVFIHWRISPVSVSSIVLREVLLPIVTSALPFVFQCNNVPYAYLAAEFLVALLDPRVEVVVAHGQSL